MRIIFMGSPDFAVPSLTALVEGNYDVVAAYCQPPRSAGRGKAERKTAVQTCAEALRIPVFTPATLRDADAQAEFAAHEADLAVVAAYGLILPKEILEAPKVGCVNVHASLLPRWRGAAPVQRAILAGDETSGITIMRMDEGLDTGPMLLQREISIIGKSAGQVTEELAKLGAVALLEWLDNPSSGECQPDVGATYAKKVDKVETRIDWSQPAEQVERQVRAFAPAPGAWFEAAGERLKLLDAECVDGAGKPGEVVGSPLVVACGEDAVHCRTLQRAGKAPMPVEDLLRGFPIPEGTILA